MKAARRHELKENELIKLLGDVREFLQKYGTYVAGGVLIIVVVLAGGAMYRRSHQSKVMRAWDRHFALREEARGLSLGQEGDAQDALARMQSLAGSTEDSSLRSLPGSMRSPTIGPGMRRRRQRSSMPPPAPTGTSSRRSPTT